jgi:alkylation response protein AidB-like acyl-CoA dehydrogenase
LGKGGWVDFDLTKEQAMIRTEVRRFAQSEIAPLAVELDEKEEFFWYVCCRRI